MSDFLDDLKFPIVKRVYTKTLASDLVPMKPMGMMSEEELRQMRRREEINKRNKKIQKILDRIKKENN